MAVPESQLETWSHLGSVAQSASTYATIKGVLEDPNAPYANKDFTIFLQGSYANDTNIYADSDVDVVICLTSTYYHDVNDLNDREREMLKQNFSPASYSLNDFKAEVTQWLTHNFGRGVKAGNKAIYVPASGNRREVDVLVCAEYRRYYSYTSAWSNNFHSGITFWSAKGTQIINFPRQHSANATAKHQKTQSRFKPLVRVLKNMRNRMQDEGRIEVGLAPSYFIEGMLYNVPEQKFGVSFTDRFEGSISWLQKCDSSKLVCANELYVLLHDYAQETWREADFRTFLYAVGVYWNN